MADGVMNGTTDVEWVAAPPDDTTRTMYAGAMRLHNTDTATVNLIVWLERDTGGHARTRTLYDNDVSVDETWIWPYMVRLESPSDRIVAKLGGAVAANQPEWSVEYTDST
jgi:hypothetical protein